MSKYIVISGAGSGIGAAMAKEFSRHPDHHLILVGRRPEKLEETKSCLEGDHSIIATDVLDYTNFREKLKETLGEDKGLYAIIANHGVGGENHYGENDRFDEIVEINLKGTYRLVNECLPYLKKSVKNSKAFSHVLVTSSILSRFGVPGYSGYCASKAALLGLVKSWAVEWAREKILVNALCPGWVNTEMAEQGIELMAKGQSRPYEDVYKEQMSFVPLGKMSEPEEIASFANYLISEQNTSITGQSLDINNGAYMI